METHAFVSHIVRTTESRGESTYQAMSRGDYDRIMTEPCELVVLELPSISDSFSPCNTR
jgi:hypothetical protein